METLEMETEVNQVEDKMKDEMARLSIPVLKELLGRYGHVADESVTKAELIDAIVALNAAAIKEADEEVAKAKANSESDDDPTVTMEFQSLESPGTDYEFCWQPPDGCFKKNEAGKCMVAPKWHFYPGRQYEVPLSLVEHLNSLRVPADRQVNLDNEGFVQSLYSQEKQNRFSCRIILTDEQRKQLKG